MRDVTVILQMICPDRPGLVSELAGWVAANGGNILVDDYTVQPVLDCDSSEINEIGVLAHEIGHAFGLPDLYGTGSDHGGVGRWGLMGSGAWGCDGTICKICTTCYPKRKKAVKTIKS